MINLKELSLISGKAAWMAYLVITWKLGKIMCQCLLHLIVVFQTCICVYMSSEEMSDLSEPGHILFGC